MTDMDVDTPAPVPGQFTEHTNLQGRMYWYDTVNKTSHWEKPLALQSAFERAMAATPWKEYTSKGRKYWVHGETKMSVWELPEDLAKLKQEHAADDDVAMSPAPAPAAAQQQQFPPPAIPTGPKAMVNQSSMPAAALSPSVALAAGLPSAAAQHGSATPEPASTTSTALALVPQGLRDTLPATPAATGFSPPARQSPLTADLPPAPYHADDGYWAGPRDRYVIPPKGWQTAAQAEEAFEYLLQKAGVEAGWTWDVAMRAIITDPLYKSLHTLAEKKVVFNRYLVTLKATQAQEREARLVRLRPQFHKLLDGHPQVYAFSTLRTMSREFAGNSIWESASEDERSVLWDEFAAKLKEKEAAEQRDLRKRNLAVLTSIFDTLSITPHSRWAQFSVALGQHPTFVADPLLAQLDPLEVVTLYEERLDAAEAAYESQRAKDRLEQRRAARHAREAFKRLLDGLVDDGTLTWQAKWRPSLPLWRDSAEYRALLGQPGSSALDLFHDVVDGLTLALEAKAKSVGALLEGEGVKVELSTERSAFDVGLDKIKFQGNGQDRDDLWNFTHGRLVAKAAEEERKRERRRRDAIDDLRYAVRKIEPPLPLDAPFDQVEKDIDKLKEARALEDAADLKTAWDKHVLRAKERLRERDQPSSSSRDHLSHGHERDHASRGSEREREERRGSRELGHAGKAGRESDRPRKDDRGEKRGGTMDGDKATDPRDAKRAKVHSDLEDGEI